jgi:hypothetical protein
VFALDQHEGLPPAGSVAELASGLGIAIGALWDWHGMSRKDVMMMMMMMMYRAMGWA